MINWLDIRNLAKVGSPTPPRRVEKSDAEWQEILTPDQFRVMRQHGTERAFSGENCSVFEPALYGCGCCGTPLFDSREKFESGTGWPSFTQPVTGNVVRYIEDSSFGMTRIETVCNVCDAHLGHVFPDGPMPSGLRYCINSVSLQKTSTMNKAIATFGGGCFWCTEAIFAELRGVEKVTSGYAGGTNPNPTYKEVCSGTTGHAEVIQVVYDSSIIPFDDLLRVHMNTHDPTTLDRQGADKGSQYRSVVYYDSEEEKAAIEKVIAEEQGAHADPIVTEVSPMPEFFAAEDYHQSYFENNPGQPYCLATIPPKLKKLREKYGDKVKTETV